MIDISFFAITVDILIMKKIFFLILFCNLVFLIHSETFRYRYDLWKNYKLVTETVEDVYLNDQYLQMGKITSRSSFTRQEEEGQGAYYHVTLMNLEQTEASWGEIFEISSENKFDFHRDDLGYMDVPEDSLYPVLRNLLVFPENDLTVGDQWDAIGEEVHDLSRSYDVEHIRFPRRVLYTYKGQTQWNEQTLHLIETSSQFSVKPDFPGTPNGYFYPAQVKGYTKRNIYWDNQAGRPVRVVENFYISFLLADLQNVVYSGIRESLYEYPDPVNREQEMEEVQDILNQQGIEDTDISSDEEGMILTLNKIHFAPDSYQILPEEQNRIETLAEILKKFPGRDIIISGHTADVGNPEFQSQLSKYRANEVADMLQDLLGDRRGILITRGYGGTQPVAENDSELGRAQNRRVELKILDN